MVSEPLVFGGERHRGLPALFVHATAHGIREHAFQDRWIDRRVLHQRSKFFQEAVEEKLKIERRLRAFDKVRGSLKDKDIPGWETPESAIEWVRAGRRGLPWPPKTDSE